MSRPDALAFAAREIIVTLARPKRLVQVAEAKGAPAQVAKTPQPIAEPASTASIPPPDTEPSVFAPMPLSSGLMLAVPAGSDSRLHPDPANDLDQHEVRSRVSGGEEGLSFSTTLASTSSRARERRGSTHCLRTVDLTRWLDRRGRPAIGLARRSIHNQDSALGRRNSR